MEESRSDAGGVSETEEKQARPEEGRGLRWKNAGKRSHIRSRNKSVKMTRWSWEGAPRKSQLMQKSGCTTIGRIGMPAVESRRPFE